jgi:hypothetical protein
MHLTTAGTFAACIAVSQAFRDTSPFILFSSSPLPAALQDVSAEQLQSSTDVLRATKEFLSTCPSDIYVIISQPNANAADYSSHGCVPYLRRAMSNEGVQTKFSVSEVVGLEEGNADDLADYVSKNCGHITVHKDISDPVRRAIISDDAWWRKIVVRSDYHALPSKEPARRDSLSEHDTDLHAAILKDMRKYTYTVIYTTTPASGNVAYSGPSYEAVFMEPVHMDLKRQSGLAGVRDNNSTLYDSRPLFEKYQFLSPGLFMGLLVGLILFGILSVGINAVSSLQVSYGAFDKEMGPAVQKKQQ